MAEPKKRTNKSKRNMRRMHDKISAAPLVYCPSCHAAMRPHNICQNCGTYKGQTVIEKPDEVEIKADSSDKNK